MNEWISIKTALPKDKTDIFIWKTQDSENVTKGWYFGTYINGKGIYSYGNLQCVPLKIFSHWMYEMVPPIKDLEDKYV